jgi:hypothetical protein
MNKPHLFNSVQQAITQLADALGEFERDTGIQSALIIRQGDGFEYRALSGKPIPDGVSDDDLLIQVIEPPPA